MTENPNLLAHSLSNCLFTSFFHNRKCWIAWQLFRVRWPGAHSWHDASLEHDFHHETIWDDVKSRVHDILQICMYVFLTFYNSKVYFNICTIQNETDVFHFPCYICIMFWICCVDFNEERTTDDHWQLCHSKTLLIQAQLL